MSKDFFTVVVSEKWLKRKAREMIKSKKEDYYTKVKEDLVLLYLSVGTNIHHIKHENYTELNMTIFQTDHDLQTMNLKNMKLVIYNKEKIIEEYTEGNKKR